MTIQQILYDFNLAADRLDSKSLVNLRLPAKIRLLNKAQRSVVKQRYREFQLTEKRIEDLQKLEVIEESLKALPWLKREHAYEVEFKQRPLFLTRKYALASTACCKAQRIRLHDTQSDDFELRLGSSVIKPSFLWRRALVRRADDKMYVYSEKGMAIDHVVVDYLRYPVDMDMTGYTHFNGEPSKDVSCELVELVDEIINEAVLNTRLDAGDVAAAQAVMAKVQRQE